MKKYTYIILLMIMSVGMTNAQWITLNSGSGILMEQVFFPSDSIGYMLDYNGDVFKTSDGGQTWSSPSQPSLGGFFFLSADTGFGGEGFGNESVYKTVDGANSWNKIITTGDFVFSFSFPGNGNVGYMAGMDSSRDTIVIYKTHDRGVSWSRNAIILADYFFLDNISVCFTDTSTGYLFNNNGGVLYKTINGAASWFIQVDTIAVTAVSFPTKDTGYAVGDSIYKTTNGGQNWVAQNQVATNTQLNTVFFTTTQTGFAAGGDGFSVGNLIQTFDGGQTWTLALNNSNTFYSIYFPSTNVGYACGANGEIFRYDQLAGISELTDQDKISLSPNPATTQLTIQTSSSRICCGTVIVSIMNVLGQEALPPTALYMKGEDAIIDVSKLSAGIYFVQMKSEKGSVVKKFVKE